MKYGFLHTAAVSPALHVADCAYNTQQIIAAMRAQAVAGTKLLCLPEFTLTGYTCSDLFLQETLCRGAEDGLIQILDASKELDVVALVGLPVRHNGKQAPPHQPEAAAFNFAQGLFLHFVQLVNWRFLPFPGGSAIMVPVLFYYGNTAQFPPDGLSTAPAAAARHLRCQNAR